VDQLAALTINVASRALVGDTWNTHETLLHFCVVSRLGTRDDRLTCRAGNPARRQVRMSIHTTPEGEENGHSRERKPELLLLEIQMNTAMCTATQTRAVAGWRTVTRVCRYKNGCMYLTR
jgi:hypothetical protein